ncbi:hypothetical protein GGS21DRAFT_502503 [Xylaria nigripes]|nr:hypothetical protein GGS21DRAFT_502503 [Xylaria nigripes]
MEPPQKRLKLDTSLGADDETKYQDELSMTQAQFDVIQDPMYEFDKGRAKAATRLKSAFEDIFEKYGKDFTGADDVINFYTDEIEVDHGHVQSLENREDWATDDSLSSDEESRIVNGKSSDRGRKSQSNSLVPAKYANKQTARCRSPWNEPPSLATCRLSPLASSSSPCGADAPFGSGSLLFGNVHVDPIWQAPDLPAQPFNYHNDSLMESQRSQSGYFGGQLNHFPKKRVNTRSFLPCAASSEPGVGEVEDNKNEEDEILLGRKSGKILPGSQLGGHKGSIIPYSSRISSQKLGRITDQQPLIRGVDPPVDERQSNPNGLQVGTVQATITKAVVKEADRVARQPAEHQTAIPPHRKRGRPRKQRDPESVPVLTQESQITAPRRKRGRPKKVRDLESVPVPTQKPETETQELEQNRKRIEVVLPMRSHLSSQQSEQTTKETAEVNGKTPRKLNIEATQPSSSSNTSQSTGNSDDIIIKPSSTSLILGLQMDNIGSRTISLVKDLKHDPASSKDQDCQLKRNKRKREQVDNSNAFTQPRRKASHETVSSEDTQESEASQRGISNSTNTNVPYSPGWSEQKSCDKPGITINDKSQELETSQTEFSNFRNDNVSNNPGRPESKSSRNNATEKVALHQRVPPIPNTGGREDKIACSSCLEDFVKPVLVDKGNFEVASMQPPLSQEEMRETTCHKTDEHPDPASTDRISLPAMMTQKRVEPYENDDKAPNAEPAASPTIIDQEDPVFIPVQISNNATLSQHSLKFTEVVDSSETPNTFKTQIAVPERDIRCPGPQPSALCETTESNVYQGEGCFSPPLGASVTSLGKEHSTSKIAAQQLDPCHQSLEQSTSLGIMESSKQNVPTLSIYPTTQLVFRFLSPPIETDTHNINGARCPSPELGTPTGPEIIRGIIAPIKGSPTPETSTKRRRPGSAKSRNTHDRAPWRGRFPFTSLMPGGIDDESEDELRIERSSSCTTDDSPILPPLQSTPRKGTRKYGYFNKTSISAAQTPNRKLKFSESRNMPPATDSGANRSQRRQQRGNRTVHSSPLARTVAERLLSSPTKRHRARQFQSVNIVASTQGELRRCGDGGFICGRDFCLTCCL